MFFDTGLNLPSTMLNNVGKAFSETATKMLVDIAYLLLTSKTRKMRYPDYVCDVKKCEVAWLAYNAFHKVLLRRQSKYSPTLAWLQLEMTRLSTLKDIRHGRVRDVV
ncbi:hypothetical protein F5Y16DRAFT_10909 [Xylariaceae sp. FL0255]|nr:hypothetical protein F5Y16DRAFT_10909 [Xylariaceae sp. FL0255]